jgi:hypothetical protein
MKKWIMVIACLMAIFVLVACDNGKKPAWKVANLSLDDTIDSIYDTIDTHDDTIDTHVCKFFLRHYPHRDWTEIIIIGKDYNTYALLSDSVDIEWIDVHDWYNWLISVVAKSVNDGAESITDYNFGFLNPDALLKDIKKIRNKFDKCCEISEKNNIESFEKTLLSIHHSKLNQNITYQRYGNKDYLNIGGYSDDLMIETNDIDKVIKFAEKTIEKNKTWELNRKNKENLYKNI